MGLSEWYVLRIFVKCDEMDGDGEVEILKLEDTKSYTSVYNEAVTNIVFEIFKETFKNEVNFGD